MRSKRNDKKHLRLAIDVEAYLTEGKRLAQAIRTRQMEITDANT